MLTIAGGILLFIGVALAIGVVIYFVHALFEIYEQSVMQRRD